MGPFRGWVGVAVVAIGCGGDTGGDAPGETPPGVREGAGWRTVFAYTVDGSLGTDGRRLVYPVSMDLDGPNLQVLYSSDAAGQQGEIGTRLLLQLTGGAGTLDRPAGVPFPGNQVADFHQYFWDTHQPVAFRIYQIVGQGVDHVGFTKGNLELVPNIGDPPPKGFGRGAIGPDGALYAFGVIPFVADPSTGSWRSMTCSPLGGVPPVNQIGTTIQDVEASDPTRFLQLSIGGPNIQIWRHDPDLPPEPTDLRPQCRPIAEATATESLSRAFYRVIDGKEKVIAHGETTLFVYTYEGDALTLEAETPIVPATPPFGLGIPHDTLGLATDGRDLWIGYLDGSNDNRVTVKVQRGATFETVGQAGFSTSVSSVTPTLAASETGQLFVGLSEIVEGGYGHLWIASPE